MGEIEAEQRVFEPSKGESGTTFWAYARGSLPPRIPNLCEDLGRCLLSFLFSIAKTRVEPDRWESARMDILSDLSGARRWRNRDKNSMTHF